MFARAGFVFPVDGFAEMAKRPGTAAMAIARGWSCGASAHLQTWVIVARSASTLEYGNARK
jgi:hypothetical protein